MAASRGAVDFRSLSAASQRRREEVGAAPYFLADPEVAFAPATQRVIPPDPRSWLSTAMGSSATSLAVLWAIACCVSIWGSLQAMVPEARELFLIYFQPFAPLVIMAWLWALVLAHLRELGVDLAACYREASHHIPTPGQVADLAAAGSSLILTPAAVFAWSAARYTPGTLGGIHNLSLMMPILAYVLPVAGLAVPVDALHLRLRRSFLRTVGRVILPFWGMNFADFLLADVLTSLAKSLSDMERALCRMTAHWSLSGTSLLEPVNPQWGSADDVCLNSSWGIALALALPYAVRLVQCFGVWRGGNRAQLFNMIKYATALPVVFLSTAKYHVDADTWHGGLKAAWTLSAVINTAYSVFWDIDRDWGLQLFRRTPALLGPRPVLFHPRLMYLLAVLSNALMRVLWLYKLSPHLRSDLVVLSTAGAIECLRRWQWLYFRIEQELITQGFLVLDHGRSTLLERPRQVHTLRGLGLGEVELTEAVGPEGGGAWGGSARLQRWFRARAPRQGRGGRREGRGGGAALLDGGKAAGGDVEQSSGSQ